jgi:nitroreductase
VTLSIPDQPQFGEPLPLAGSAQVLAFLARRRSASAVTLRAPAPDAHTLETLLRLAVRVPDHGKLAPWRFVIFEGEAKARAGAALAEVARSRPDAPKATAALAKFNTPPLAVVVISRVKPGDIPEWEQVMSAGAVCMTLVNAASAAGFGANWITDWYSFDDAAKPVLGVQPGERVAGVVYLGTPNEAPLERARPDLASLITRA